MPAAIHIATVSKIPGAMSRSDLRPARNLCARTSASISTKLAIAKRPKVITLLSGSRPQHGRPDQGRENHKESEGQKRECSNENIGDGFKPQQPPRPGVPDVVCAVEPDPHCFA